MRKFRTLLAAGAMAALAAIPVAWAAGFFTNGVPPAGGTQFPFTMPPTGNETFPLDTNLANGQAPQSESMTISQLSVGLAETASPRNYADNGALQIVQQLVNTNITGGTTSITALQFAADRWFVDTNVGSGAGHAQVVTSSPSPPAGFQNVMKVWRQSGALTQQVCILQELETWKTTQLQGKSVILSASTQALAALTSVAGNVNAYIITGTGTDEGLGTLTASPAITPAWTGLVGGVTPLATWGNNVASPAWVRQQTPVFNVPTNATELGMLFCFTPVGSASGTTDGFAITGIQLEVVYPTLATNPISASTFDYQMLIVELREAQRFFFQLNEPASGAGINASCYATGATANACTIPLPTIMRGTTPTIAIGTAGTFKVNIAGTPTTIATPTAGVCSVTACTVTAANTNTAGQAEQFTGGGGTGVWTVSSDKVM